MLILAKKTLRLVKRKFFVFRKTDLTQECVKMFDLSDKTFPAEELKQEEENLESYKVTTRW